jgi:DNA repair protein RecN (Recombination protein N)
MLLHLKIQNIAIIESLAMDFHQGFHVLTGETGAGKSILLGALGAVLGHRIQKDIIRTGTTHAMVEALFQLDSDFLFPFFEEFGIPPEEDGTLILQREIHQNGKNICRINGRLVTQSVLKTWGEKLVDIHGQHDHQSLLRKETHIELLDSFADSSIQDLKNQYLEVFEENKRIEKEIESMRYDPSYRERRLDVLHFQIEEILNANLQKDEDAHLQHQRLLLNHAQKIKTTLSNLYEWLYISPDETPSCNDRLSLSLKELSFIKHLDSVYEEIFIKLQDLSYGLEDLTQRIRENQETNEDAQILLEKVDERLDWIGRLKRKYGDSIEEIFHSLQKMQQEQAQITNSEENAKALYEKRVSLNEKLLALSISLNEERKKAGVLLEQNIIKELQDLEMKNTHFIVDISFQNQTQPSMNHYTKNGLNQVEFLISTNMGEPLKPLSKIASGGEMSRIMLGIKTILAKMDPAPTLIFDEVDTGISGLAAQKVGRKLSFLSKNHQVIAITHLAQIACMGDHHYLIEKHQQNNQTRTSITPLQGEQVVSEIARILGGNQISQITLKHAEELLKNAKT